MLFKKFYRPAAIFILVIIVLAIVLGFLFLVPRFKPNPNPGIRIESSSKNACTTDKSRDSLIGDLSSYNKDEIPVELPESLYFCGQPFPLLCYSDSLQFFKSLDYFLDRLNWVMTLMIFFGRYSPYTEKILQENGLPDDIKYLPIIESSLDLRAKSWAKAVGYWQFTKPTAVKYGLIVNNEVDQRLDPILSARAAARYLKDLYNEFGDWNLALAAYNAGEGAIKRALKKHKEEGGGLFSLSQLYLPDETQNYPFLIAAFKFIYENPEIYQAEPEPLEFDTVTVRIKKKALTLSEIAAVCGVTGPAMRDLNPAFLKGRIPRGQWTLYLPQGTREKFLTKFGQ